MRTRSVKLGLAAGLAMLVGAAALCAPSLAAPSTIYCVDGVSTTLPTPITASSVSAGSDTATLFESLAISLINNNAGSFAYGYFPGNVAQFHGWSIVVAGDPITSADLEPGWTDHAVAVGTCVSAAASAAWVPSVTHVGVCKLLSRSDGTTGLFQEITVANWNDRDGKYFDAPAASWVEGVGLTCDNPVALGYKPAGYHVAWGGKPSLLSDTTGVRASGLNDIYPYFTR
jgi:hypothetical protein